MATNFPPGIRQVFVPHKELEEGWTYVSIPDDDMVIGVKVAITKVLKLVGADNMPVKDVTDNNDYAYIS
jgi:hypothetical protein